MTSGPCGHHHLGFAGALWLGLVGLVISQRPGPPMFSLKHRGVRGDCGGGDAITWRRHQVWHGYAPVPWAGVEKGWLTILSKHI